MTFLLLVATGIGVGGLQLCAAYVYWRAGGQLLVAGAAISMLSAYGFQLLLNNGAGMAFSGLVALGIGGAVSWSLAVVGRRMSGSDFLLIGLAAAEVFKRMILQYRDLTGGSNGLAAATPMIASQTTILVICALIPVLLLLMMAALLRSSRGLSWRLAGGAPLGAALMGVDLDAVRRWMAIVSGVCLAAGGILYAVAFRFVHPDDLGISVALAALAGALAVRPHSFLRDLSLASVILFGGRELLRFVEIGGNSRFGLFEVILGSFLIWIALRLGNEQREHGR